MSTIEATGRAPQRRRGLVIALIVSLAINVFFIAGLVGHLVFHFQFGHPPMGPIQRFERASHEMDLSGAQLAAFNGMIATLRQHRRETFQKNRPLFDQIWDQLAKPQPDEKAIADLITQADANHVAFQKDATAAMESFLATLSLQQRAQFADLVKWPQPVPPHP
ncbi:MAG TPA: periplasmic heavy metal sensor [Stellaceae bacterium]|nr:periplasmic heavy metal sensor [Stellaceae bacterium]